MIFSRLKIVGFKSFCDNTELHLEPGLTGVVGPNGCGKSNLVEAMRWVMGESSYKAMRASGMDDVIFSGSGNRPGRNSAEVTLVLDNADRTAPAQLNNADVLEVTRRIEREQGSSYRVNGREVRARDVQLLFADASTGAHSPALVRQGQIGELISAKPVQRRALLEEAAGISGLHSRRHEAELRLRAAEQNLERVDDVIAQIEQQLETLKRQARLATRYRNLSGEIRKAEATLFHLRWVKARVGEKEAEAEQGQLINKLAEATHIEQQAQKAVELTEQKMRPLREQEAAEGAALQRVRILRDQLEDEMRRADARRHELDERQRQVVADQTRETSLVAEAQRTIEAAEAELASLGAQADGERAAAEQAGETVAAANAKLQQAEIEARAGTDALAQLRARRAQNERQLREADARATRLEAQIADVDKETQRVQSEAEADQRLLAWQAQLQAARDRAAEAEAAAERAEKSTAERQSALEAARPELDAVKSERNRAEGEATSLSRLLTPQTGTLWPAIVDSLSVDPGYETALGAALGDDLDASSDDGAPLHWCEPGDKQTDASLPAGVEPLSQYVRGASLLERRLHQIGLVSQKDGDRFLKALKPGQRLVSVQGDLWRWDGFVAAADAPTAAAQRLAQRNRLAELDAEIAGIKIRHQEIEARIGALTEARGAAQTEEKAARDAWRQAQHLIADAQSGLDIAQKAAGDLANRQSALAEARVRLASSLAEAQAIAEDARKALQDDGDESEVAARAEELGAGVSRLRQEAEQARLTLANFESGQRLRDNRMRQLQGDKQSWEQRVAGARNQLATLERRASEIAAQLADLGNGPEQFTARQEELETRIFDAEDAHKRAADALAAAENDRRDADRAQRLAHDGVSGVREILARVEERLKGAISQRQQIEHLCVEVLSVAANKTAELAGLKPEAPLPREEDVERRVERLKAERERLGGVNLGAEREAEEIGEKLETMIADREDLVAAIAKLRTGISNLNREGRARLSEAFDKVNGYFGELFTSLFGGGTAELAFIENEDPLQAGLEIIARPPGKKPQTLTLLSGGEQALTVLSLIFAVFLTNPAPICVLDEVDAPLDDANVERFCNLLDTMRQKTDTRFVVITHNPITMSRVDRLFGVTMAEKGVSQLVSVDLKTAHEVAEAV